MMVNWRRSNIEIIADMLRVGENGAGKTEIMYSANMSYAQIQKYLGFLMSQGFINRVEAGNPVVTYHVTDKGLKLLRSIENIVEMLGLDGDSRF
jgi:predicted transcriptional regulator